MQTLLSFIFPPRCPVCDGLRYPWENVCCPECRRKLRELGESVCFRCGRPTEETEEYCISCRKRMPCFERGFSAFRYEGAARESVLGFKFLEREANGAFYAGELLRLHGAALRGFAAEAVVPVPIHRRKLRQRGYNQAQVLARELADGLRLPCEPRLLVRTRYTAPQKELNAAERLKNLNGAFAIARRFRRKKRRMPESVLLVDDILTTGSTLEACARVLKSGGVRRVAVVTVCSAGSSEAAEAQPLNSSAAAPPAAGQGGSRFPPA